LLRAEHEECERLLLIEDLQVRQWSHLVRLDLADNEKKTRVSLYTIGG
jgi:hypothetical protein